MCWFFIVIKVLMLKLLLASISGLSSASGYAYEYGYHPSAEEFDNLLRETHRTWTHDILNQQSQRRLYQKVATTLEPDEVRRSFVPKFQYESHLNKFNQISPNVQHSSPNSHDLQALPSDNHMTIQNVGSSLDFHYINENDGDGGMDDLVRPLKPQPFNYDNGHQETNVQLSSTTHRMPEINLKPLSRPEMEKYSLNNLYKNNTQAHFPIYFTNPATGIVYAITEMGKSSLNANQTNGSIPIFITKEQYERDILLLKTEYESQCALKEKDKNKNSNRPKIPSSFSRPSTTTTTTSTTMRPQIIRLQRPSISSTSSVSKLITPLGKPLPVIVKTALNVKDHNRPTTARPTKKKNKTKNKRKAKKKTKPPGHHKVSSTPKPNEGGPTIVKGTRTTTSRPHSDAYKLPTQLEKPNFGTTTFSNRPLAATASHMGWGDHLNFNKLQRNRRAIEDMVGYTKAQSVTDNKILKSKKNVFAKKNMANLRLKSPKESLAQYLNLDNSKQKDNKQMNKVNLNTSKSNESDKDFIINPKDKINLYKENIESFNKNRYEQNQLDETKNYRRVKTTNDLKTFKKNNKTQTNTENTNELNEIQIKDLTENPKEQVNYIKQNFNENIFQSMDKIKQNTFLKEIVWQHENEDKLNRKSENTPFGYQIEYVKDKLSNDVNEQQNFAQTSRLKSKETQIETENKITFDSNIPNTLNNKLNENYINSLNSYWIHKDTNLIEGEKSEGSSLKSFENSNNFQSSKTTNKISNPQSIVENSVKIENLVPQNNENYESYEKANDFNNKNAQKNFKDNFPSSKSIVEISDKIDNLVPQNYEVHKNYREENDFNSKYAQKNFEDNFLSSKNPQKLRNPQPIFEKPDKMENLIHPNFLKKDNYQKENEFNMKNLKMNKNLLSEDYFQSSKTQVELGNLPSVVEKLYKNTTNLVDLKTLKQENVKKENFQMSANLLTELAKNPNVYNKNLINSTKLEENNTNENDLNIKTINNSINKETTQKDVFENSAHRIYLSSKTPIKIEKSLSIKKNPYEYNKIQHKYDIKTDLVNKKLFKLTEDSLKFIKNVSSKWKNLFGKHETKSMEIPNESEYLMNAKKQQKEANYPQYYKSLLKSETNFEINKMKDKQEESIEKSQNHGKLNFVEEKFKNKHEESFEKSQNHGKIKVVKDKFSNEPLKNVKIFYKNYTSVNPDPILKSAYETNCNLKTSLLQSVTEHNEIKKERMLKKNNDKSIVKQNLENTKESLLNSERIFENNSKITKISDKLDLDSVTLIEKDNFKKKINDKNINVFKLPKQHFFKSEAFMQEAAASEGNRFENFLTKEIIKNKQKILKLKQNFKNHLKIKQVSGVESIPKKFALNKENKKEIQNFMNNSKIQYRLENEISSNNPQRNTKSLKNSKKEFKQNIPKLFKQIKGEETDFKNIINLNKITGFPSHHNESFQILETPKASLNKNQFEPLNQVKDQFTENVNRTIENNFHTNDPVEPDKHKHLNITDSILTDLKPNYNLKPLTLSESHHLRKRSADIINEKATAPRFIQKSIKSTNSNNTLGSKATIERLSRKFDNSKGGNQTDENSRSSTNSKITNFRKTSSTKNSGLKTRKTNRKKYRKSQNRTKTLKTRKRNKVVSKLNITALPDISNNSTNITDIQATTPRSLKTTNKDHKRAKVSQEDAEGEYDLFDVVEDDDDDDEYSDEDDDDDDEEEEYDEPDSTETDLEEEPITDNSSSADEAADYGAMEEDHTENVTDENIEQNSQIKSSPTYSDIKKRYRRRPSPSDNDDDDEDDEEDDSAMGSNLGGFFRMIFYPVQMVLSGIMDSFGGGGKETEEESPSNPYTQYTSYHNTLKQHSSDDYAYDDEDDDGDYYNDSGDSSLTGWFSSLFGLNRRNKKIGSTTVAPAEQHGPSKQSNWFQSWFGFGGSSDGDGVDKADAVTYDDGDAYDKWFASWFGDIKPKARKRTTTTTTTTTQLPQVPILTIVDPMRNPQNWIGILAHHIINHTSTTTQNPLKDIWAKVTSPATTTTTENPDIPRKISYNKYQIWRLKPQDDSQVQALEEYKKGDDGIKLQWLKGPSLRGLTDVLVPPRMLVDFQASLTFESIDHEVLIFDVGKAIAYEKTKEDYLFTTTQKPKKHKNQNRYTNKPQALTWMRYYEFDDIVTYLENMRMRYPQLVELIHIGRSYEGRPLIVMKIESKEAAATNSAHLQMHEKSKLRNRKRSGLANAVFIEAGVHGTEWIAPATATWIINELLKTMKNNKTATDEQRLIRNTTWYIMPILNPDGYVYSHEYDRFWKKSRSRHISRPSGLIDSAMTWLQKKKTKEKVCYGVDLDRNWNYQWGKRGSSRTPCNEFYAGPGPFSEPETKALSEFLMDYRTHIKLYISMQAYGQIISYPYKANTTYDTERLDDFLDVAMVGTDGLRKKGSKARYKIDSTNDLVENRSGSSDAFVAYDVGIPFSYTMHLADNGVHGYLLPSAAIESTSRDAFEIIVGMLDYI